jgi:serine/threonine-protein kinase
MPASHDWHDSQTPRAVLEWVDAIADRFESAWKQGQRPIIAAFLRRAETSEVSATLEVKRLALLHELIALDMEYRWQAGEQCKIEAYLAEFPELLAPDGSLPEALVRRVGPLGEKHPEASWPGTTNFTAPLSSRDEPPGDVGSCEQLPPRTLGKFQLIEMLGAGSFGAVYKARDTQLGRLVAIKIPRGGSLGTAEERQRFLREAKSAAQLKHPHIVPVHDIVHDSGITYLVSDFIEGHTLAQLMAQRRPGHKEAAELLASVADGLQYAHDQKIVHRDIAPKNILIDAAGRPFITDFGLARRDEGSMAVTLEGQVLGTPAYMSPEQASGQSAKVDGRSDVYSVGVILYEMLTGTPPFSGSVRMVLHQVIHDEPRLPRRLSERVPHDLETICLKCLHKQPARRYASAGALADDLRRYLRGVPITARPVSRAERAWRWCRRNPVVATLAVGLLLAAAGLAVGLVVVNAEKVRTRQALAAESEALKRSQASEKSASEQRQLALKTVRQVVDDIHARLKDRPGHAELRKALLAQALAGLQDVARAADTAAQVDHATIWVYFELGDLFLFIEEGGTAQAKKQYERAHELSRQLVDLDPGNAEAQRDLAISYDKLGNVQMQLGDSKAALAAYQQSLAVNERLARAEPQSEQAQRGLAVSYCNLGDARIQLGDSQAALAAYKQGLAGFERLARANPQSTQAQRDLSLCHDRLGDVWLRQLGDPRAARTAYQKSLAVAERLARADPQSTQAQRDLSITYERLGDVQMQLGEKKAALAAYRQSLAVAEPLARADPQNAQARRDLSVSYEKMAEVQIQLGDRKAALVAYQQSLAGFEPLARSDPQNSQAQHDLLRGYDRVADVRLQLGDIKAALSACQQGVQVRERLARAYPQKAELQHDLAHSYNRLGEWRMRLGDNKAALAAYQQSLAGFERLARANPDSKPAQHDLSVSYDRLGNMQMRLGDHRAARAAYEQGRVLRERLARADPQSAPAHRNLQVSYFKLGSVEQQAGEFRKAADWYARGLDISKRFSSPDFFKKEVAVLQGGLRFCRAAVEAQADPAAALKQPEDLRLSVLSAVTAALARQKKPEQALAAAELLAANAKDAAHLYDAACGYALCVPLAGTAEAKEKRAGRAVELLRLAVNKGFKDAVHLKRDADLDVLRGRADFKKLAAEVEAATAAKRP